MSDEAETNTAQQAALQEYVDLMLMGEDEPVVDHSTSDGSEVLRDSEAVSGSVDVDVDVDVDAAPDTGASAQTRTETREKRASELLSHQLDSRLAPRSQTMFVNSTSKQVPAIDLEQRLVKARVQKLAERTIAFHQQKIEQRRFQQQGVELNPSKPALTEPLTPTTPNKSAAPLENKQLKVLLDEQQRDEAWAEQLEQEYLADQARRKQAEIEQALHRKQELERQKQRQQQLELQQKQLQEKQLQEQLLQEEQLRQQQAESLRLESIKRQEEQQRLEQEKILEAKQRQREQQRQQEQIRMAQEEQIKAAELAAKVVTHQHDKSLIHWAVNGRPIWAQEAFDCLFFEVSGLTLAVPLVELGSIYPVNEELTPLFGQADWFMGLMPVGDHNIRIVNTPKIVMPERYNPAFVETMNYVISIHGYSWGLAVDQVREAITLQPSDVRWRSEGSKRPWLAGTVVEHMCALIDVKALAEMLDGNDKNHHQKKK